MTNPHADALVFFGHSASAAGPNQVSLSTMQLSTARVRSNSNEMS
jgi:hypothetical protein